MPVDIPDALKSLGDLADRIAALLEWDKLAQQERRPGIPTSFTLRDHFEDDIKDLYGTFVESFSGIRELLDLPDPSWSRPQRTKWRQQARRLGKRVHNLGVMQRFISA